MTSRKDTRGFVRRYALGRYPVRRYPVRRHAVRRRRDLQPRRTWADPARAPHCGFGHKGPREGTPAVTLEPVIGI